MSAAAIDQLIAQRVADALAEYEANQNSGNGNGNDNGNGSHDSRSGDRRTLHTARVCTYKEFLNCQPLNFKGTKGAYATCTLLGGALTWWNSYVRTVGHDAAYGMSWKTLMKMITEAYCPRSEIKKLETELWNLTVKGTDVESYTQSF
ncbi:reverse transcriptase domain-containing protein [Tanacetum coccineum]